MLYHLLYPLKEYFFAFNVFRYITFRAAYATVTALLIAFIFGPKMIRWLRNLQIGQRVRKDGPTGHAGKEGALMKDEAVRAVQVLGDYADFIGPAVAIAVR